MPSIYGFSVRSSGRDLTAVRRPRRMAPARPRVIEPVEPVEAEPVVLDDMLKSEIVALAESRGVDSSGTKAEIVARLERSDD